MKAPALYEVPAEKFDTNLMMVEMLINLAKTEFRKNNPDFYPHLVESGCDRFALGAVKGQLAATLSVLRHYKNRLALYTGGIESEVQK